MRWAFNAESGVEQSNNTREGRHLTDQRFDQKLLFERKRSAGQFDTAPYYQINATQDVLARNGQGKLL
jgi:hypothetical protein